jgi:hypothetical protein
MCKQVPKNFFVFVVISAVCVPTVWSQWSTPFSVAAPDARRIVLARVTMAEKSVVDLEIVEVLRGEKQPQKILVSRGVWDVWSPKNQPAGTTYLVLLRQGEELLCGHMNGLIVLDHSCNGILPVVRGAIPKEFAKEYDGKSNEEIPLAKIKEAIRSMDRVNR